MDLTDLVRKSSRKLVHWAQEVVTVAMLVALVQGCATPEDETIAAGPGDGPVARGEAQALIGLPPYSAANRANLVPDPSFEFAGVQQWRTYSFAQPALRSADMAYSGHHSIKLTDTSTTEAAGVVTYRVPAVPGRAYTAAAWVRRNSGTANAKVFLQFFDGLRSSNRIEPVSTTDVPVTPACIWCTASVSAVAPVGTQAVDVLVYSSQASTGTFYVDDVSLVSQDNLVPNGDFSAFKSSTSTPANWSSWNGTTLTRITSPSFEGRSAISWSDTSITESRGAASERFAVFPGQSLMLSGRALYTGARPYLYLRFFSGQNNTETVLSKSVRFPQGTRWELTSLDTVVPLDAQWAEVLIYSCGDCTGTYRFDDIRLKTAKDLLLNGDAEFPDTEWTGPVSYTVEGALHGVRSMKFTDSSTSESVAIRSQPLPVIAGRTYDLRGSIKAIRNDGYPSADDCKAWLAVEFFPSMLRTTQEDRISSEQAFVQVEYASLACADHGDRWIPRRLAIVAPEGAYAARVLLYSEQARRGSYQADAIRFGESADLTPTKTYFLGPVSAGAADGTTSSDPVKYNDLNFWKDVLRPLYQSTALEVVLTSGLYQLRELTDQLFIDRGFNTQRLTVRGEATTGTVLSHVPAAVPVDDSLSGQPMFRFDSFTAGLTIRDVTFMGDLRSESSFTSEANQVGVALEIRASDKVELTNVGFYDLLGAQGGAFSPRDGGSGLLFRDNGLARIGYDGHAHMVYCNKDGSNLQYVGNFFEDTPGGYVRHRNNCDISAIVRNRFQSTGTYFNEAVNDPDDERQYRNNAFVDWSIFNDGTKVSDLPDDVEQEVEKADCGDARLPEGDEWIGRMRATIVDNVFEYLQPFDDDESRYPFLINHSGFNPYTGDDTLALLDLWSPSSLSAAQVEAAFGVDTDDWIRVLDNDFIGEGEKFTTVDVFAGGYKFYNLDTGTCFNGSTDKKSFDIDHLLFR